MKILIAGIFLSISFLSFAGEYKIKTKVFRASYTKVGESFVVSVAYDKAVEKAYNAGFYNCSSDYLYSADETIFGYWVGKVEVNCYKKVYSNN